MEPKTEYLLKVANQFLEYRLTPTDLEKTLVSLALKEAGRNQSKAAAILGISRDRVRYAMKKWGL